MKSSSIKFMFTSALIVMLGMMCLLGFGIQSLGAASDQDRKSVV